MFKRLFIFFTGVNIATPSGGHLGNGSRCPLSYYCPTGSPLPIICNAGSYADSIGQSLCTVCPAGFVHVHVLPLFCKNLQRLLISK